ncbi:MAG: hypothetical protein LBD46_08555 [Endomicrobium sp.]|nr:hypothetical protein [Endomicrobium sp.]
MKKRNKIVCSLNVGDRFSFADEDGKYKVVWFNEHGIFLIKKKKFEYFYCFIDRKRQLKYRNVSYLAPIGRETYGIVADTILTGKFEFCFYKKVMSYIVEEYNGELVTPKFRI